MTCPHCQDAGDVFNDWTVRRELKRYRKRGPSRTTALLVEALTHEGVSGRVLIDIGGGIGGVQHALLTAGAARVVSAEASPAYQHASREEAERRGLTERIDFELGDFVEMAPSLADADVVTLDRVLCCYPDMPALVDASAGHARELWGAVFPRERWVTRVGLVLLNLFQSLRRSAFRVYLHPTREVSRLLTDRGFQPLMHENTMLWQVMVWKRG